MNSDLYLNKEIYEANVIRKCIIAFSRVAQISLVQMNNYYICNFFECLVDQEKVKDEFENYLIYLTNIGDE